MTDTMPTPAQRSRFHQLRIDAAYLLLSWPLILIGFILVITLLLTGVGTAIIWIGLPILSLSLLVARGFATLQRNSAAAVSGHSLVEAPYAPPPTNASVLQHIFHPIKDAQSWLDVLWLFAGFIVSTLTWCFSLTWVVGAVAGLVSPLVSGILGLTGVPNSGWAELLHLPFPKVINTASYFLVGMIFAVTCPVVLRGMATLQTSFGEIMLSSRARSRADVARLTESRDAARRVESDALRRLERDIHDGPQQRLVRLNMDLARARHHAVNDPLKTEALIDEAMNQTQLTLAELRQLSRGIAPPVLVDRGLEAAVMEAAARSAVPTMVFANIPDDLPFHVQSAAYFVVSESLANLNKHSQATSCEIFLGAQEGRLYLTVNDNGVGGAHVAKGHGLAGLEERLVSVDGSLNVDSPVGGPTTIEAVIPCGY